MQKRCWAISARRDLPLTADTFYPWYQTIDEPWRSLYTYWLLVTDLTFGWLPYTLKHGLPDET